MQNAIDMRAKNAGSYIICHQCTIREAAKVLGYSKSTLHNDVHCRLRDIDYNLYIDVQKVLDHNFNVRHIRGGESTKRRYQQMTSH